MENLEKYFIASVNKDSLYKIGDIAKDLEGLGCNIDNVLTLSGVITGSTFSTKSLESLKVDGIKKIEVDRVVKASVF